MTLRVSLNNYYQSTYSWQQFIYDFYVFMTKASPNGPGWISVGESNASSGGMGTVGLITSVSSLSGANSWYVLRSPDSKYQLLMTREAGGTSYGGAVITNSVFTGGSSSAIPSYTANNSYKFTYTTRIPSTAYKYTFNFIADDAPPYGFYAFAMYISGTPACKGAFGLVPIDVYDSRDGYPHAFFMSDQYGLKRGYVDVTYLSGVGTVGTCSFDNNGMALPCLPCSYYMNTTLQMPNAGPGGISATSSQVLALPTFFASSYMYKGLSNSWMRTPSNLILAEGDTIANKSYIRLGDWLFKWDGSTVPRLA